MSLTRQLLSRGLMGTVAASPALQAGRALHSPGVGELSALTLPPRPSAPPPRTSRLGWNKSPDVLPRPGAHGPSGLGPRCPSACPSTWRWPASSPVKREGGRALRGCHHASSTDRSQSLRNATDGSGKREESNSCEAQRMCESRTSVLLTTCVSLQS